MYPAAMWKGVPYGEEVRNLHAGNCEAFVQSTLFHRRLHSNYYHMLDCRQETDDGLSTSESQCVRTASGTLLNRDCNIQMVGSLLLSLPLAMPVSDRLVHALNQRLLEISDDGAMKQILSDWFSRIVSNCPAATAVESKTGSLPLSSMIGTLIFCGAGMLIGLLMSFSLPPPDKDIQKEENQGATQQLKGMDLSNHTSSIGTTQNWTSHKNTPAEQCQGAVQGSDEQVKALTKELSISKAAIEKMRMSFAELSDALKTKGKMLQKTK